MANWAAWHQLSPLASTEFFEELATNQPSAVIGAFGMPHAGQQKSKWHLADCHGHMSAFWLMGTKVCDAVGTDVEALSLLKIFRHEPTRVLAAFCHPLYGGKRLSFQPPTFERIRPALLVQQEMQVFKHRGIVSLQTHLGFLEQCRRRLERSARKRCVSAGSIQATSGHNGQDSRGKVLDLTNKTAIAGSNGPRHRPFRASCGGRFGNRRRSRS